MKKQNNDQQKNNNKQQIQRQPKSNQRSRKGNSTNGSIPVKYNNQFTQMKAPKVNQERSGCVIIKHKEYITGINIVPVLNQSYYQVGRYRLNPASTATFPWLSTIAQAFETYRFRKLQFCYKPRCASTIDGAVIMAPDYDAADASPISERELAMNMDSVEDSCSKTIRLNCSNARMNAAYKQHYTASDSRFFSSAQDQKTLDCGSVVVSVISTETSAALLVSFGKLWVEYEVELFIPQVVTIAPSGGAGMNKQAGLLAGSANIFTDNTLVINNQESDPVIQVLPPSSFPGPNFATFLKDWTGFVDVQATGTGLSAMPIVTRNGNNVTSSLSPLINAAATTGVRQMFSTFKQGDVLGLSPATATTLTGLILNLGASSYV